MHKQFAGIVTLLGRLALVPIFLGAAFNKITDFTGTKGYMSAQFGKLGLPTDDTLLTILLLGAIVFLSVGGVCVLAGWQAKFGALLLIIFLLAVTPIFHGFWAVPEDQFRMQFINFQKNIGLIGGLLFVMAYGPGPLSVDGKQAERRR